MLHEPVEFAEGWPTIAFTALRGQTQPIRDDPGVLHGLPVKRVVPGRARDGEYSAEMREVIRDSLRLNSALEFLTRERDNISARDRGTCFVGDIEILDAPEHLRLCPTDLLVAFADVEIYRIGERRVLVPTRPGFERDLKRARFTEPIFALAEPGVGRRPELEGFVLTQNDLAVALYDNLRAPCYRPALAFTLYSDVLIGPTLVVLSGWK